MINTYALSIPVNIRSGAVADLFSKLQGLIDEILARIKKLDVRKDIAVYTELFQSILKTYNNQLQKYIEQRNLVNDRYQQIANMA